MSAGYANNPYVLNIVPLFGVSGSASGAAGSASGLGSSTDMNGSASVSALAVNTVSTQNSGSVQFTSPVLIDVGGVMVQLQAKIAELEARIVALGG
jgi:hypothetical protein